MKNVILVGLEGNHYTLYRGLLLLLSSKFKRITFLTNNIKVQPIEHFVDKNIVTIINEEGGADEVLKRNLKLINSHDILILEYYGSYKGFIKFNFKSTKKILIVHNVNKWFQEKFRHDYKIFLLHFFKNRFFNQFDAYITMGPNIKEYFQSIKNDKPVFFFPFDQSSEKIINKEQVKETIDIVLPGTISEDRRNYKDILNVLERYYQDYPKSKIRIKFLGKIFSNNENFVIEISERINKQYGKKIFYWNSFVLVKEFEKQIMTADMVLSNLKIFNNLKDRMEIYGITKESGVSFIIYKYGKIAIVPRFQNILFGFDSQLIRFNSYKDLYEIFRKIENGEIDLKIFKRNASKNKDIFNDIIKKENIKFLKFLRKS